MNKINIFLFALLGFSFVNFVKAAEERSRRELEESISNTLKQAKQTLDTDSSQLLRLINQDIAKAKGTKDPQEFKRFLKSASGAADSVRIELGETIQDLETTKNAMESRIKEIEEMMSRGPVGK